MHPSRAGRSGTPQYKDWEACSEDCLPTACAEGECSTRLFGGNGKTGCACHHVYTRDGRNCYDTETKREREVFSYQYGNRSCCNPLPASFVNLIPVLRTEACDPLCDFIKVAVGLDRKYKTLKYYVNNQEVFQVVDIGRRLNDPYRVLEHGGYAETVDVRQVLLTFGTGSMLDASQPNNYNRYHAKNNSHDETALVPLMPIDKYAHIYANKLGEHRTKESQHFAVDRSDIKYRVFRQGDVFKIQYIVVLVRQATRSYPSLRSYCAYSACCGPRDRDVCDKRECCGDDDDSCCAGSQYDFGPFGPDERDYNIEFIQQKTATLAGDDLEPYTNAPDCDKPVQAKLVRTPRSKRYWQSQCGNGVWGDNPY